MTTTQCPQPLSRDVIVDYWAGELDVQTEAQVEEHVFACGTCAAAFAHGEAMASGIRAVVRSGMFQALVPEAVLNRLARDGTRLRTFTLGPGDVVPCAVWEDDEVIVTRLRADFSGIGSVRVVAALENGEELSRSEGITIRPTQHEIVHAISAAWLRQLPVTQVKMRITTSDEGEGQLVAEYTLMHEGSLRRG
jgi:anti-sigma factor RsiW